jgi:hypothetical protein
LEKALTREKKTLRSVRMEIGHDFHEAVWMLRLVIEQFQTEWRWLRKLSREIPRRARAKQPQYFTKSSR